MFPIKLGSLAQKVNHTHQRGNSNSNRSNSYEINRKELEQKQGNEQWKNRDIRLSFKDNLFLFFYTNVWTFEESEN